MASEKNTSNAASNKQLLKLVILGFEGALASAITGVADLFSLSGVTWQRFNQQVPSPGFQVQICSLDGMPIKCINKIKLDAHNAISNIEKCDILLIPTIGSEIEMAIEKTQSLLPHIRRLHSNGALLASNCSGAFILAESGLLDGKEATTHWGYSSLFEQRYPLIKLQTKKLITQSDGIFCAGGGMAWYDLALLLIERYQSRQVAQETAKSHLIDMQRGSQGVYANLKQHRQHKDQTVLSAQQFIEEHYASKLSVNGLANKFNMSTRSLVRRFQANVGLSPIEYIQRVRLEQAKRLLEAERINISVLSQRVGYDDSSSFSRLFKRETGLSPVQYKAKFGQELHNKH